ncbi:MAG: energy-coupled thiamine transporter ThiT [Chitinophagales bacterium]
MNRIPTRTITETGLALALAAVLHFVRIFEAPQGGSVSLEMLPLFFLALRRGPSTGILAGVLFGFLNLLLKAYVVAPIQFLLDYPIAFGVLGVAGWFAAQRPDGQVKVTVAGALAGVGLGSLLRLVAHVLSGVVYFASYAPKGQNVWVYSLLYNAGYLVPEALITAAVMWYFATRPSVFGLGVR